jgi:hypothetical protein
MQGRVQTEQVAAVAYCRHGSIAFWGLASSSANRSATRSSTMVTRASALGGVTRLDDEPGLDLHSRVRKLRSPSSAKTGRAFRIVASANGACDGGIVACGGQLDSIGRSKSEGALEANSPPLTSLAATNCGWR